MFVLLLRFFFTFILPNRQEYGKESGFTYEKVYPEKITSRSYEKNYRRPHNGNQPVEWRSGRDQSYSYSNRAEKNYTPRPIFRESVNLT